MLNNILSIPRSFLTPDGERLSLRAFIFLILLSLAFFTPGMVTMPPTDRDESLFAQATKQMIETGDYTDIRFQDTPRYKKPIGIYWLQAASVKLLNPGHLDEIWAYRVPSLVGATASVLLTAAIGALLFSPAAGLIAAMMLASGLLLNVEARLAKTDAVLLATILAAQYAMVRAFLWRAQGWAMPLLFWTALAAGILVKGPIILLPVVGTLVWLRFTNKSIAWFRDLKPGLGLLYLLALVSPWFIAINAQSHGAFAQQAGMGDMLSKLWQGQNRGAMPPGMHFMALPLLFFPFSLFLFMALPDMVRGRADAAVKFCLGWIIPTWIVFELTMTKLPHYVLPTYPALALLTAKYLLDGLPSMNNAKRRFPIFIVLSFWFIIGFGLAFMATVTPVFLGGAWSLPQVLAGVALVIMVGLTVLILPRDKVASAIMLTLASLIFINATIGDTVPKLNKVWLSRDVVAALDEGVGCPNPRLITVGYGEPSLVFLAGTATRVINDGAAAADALVAETCAAALVDFKHRDEFLAALSSRGAKPVEVRGFLGVNTGKGKEAALTLYTRAP